MKTATPRRGPPRPWQIVTWLAIWFHEHELRSIELAIEEEERRAETHAARMRSWRAWRAEKLGRIKTLRGAPGSVSYSGMVGGRTVLMRPLPARDMHAPDNVAYSDRSPT